MKKKEIKRVSRERMGLIFRAYHADGDAIAQVTQEEMDSVISPMGGESFYMWLSMNEACGAQLCDEVTA